MSTDKPKSPSWKITLTANGRGRVECDGEEVKGVRSLIVKGGGGRSPRVLIELLASSIDLNAEEAVVTRRLKQIDRPLASPDLAAPEARQRVPAAARTVAAARHLPGCSQVSPASRDQTNG